MCDSCFTVEFEKFNTYWEFDLFHEQLQEKIEVGIMTEVKFFKNQSLSYEPEYVYLCTSCNQNWALSVPDNAWRGYFLTFDKAVNYSDQLRASEKGRRVGCNILLAILVVYLAATLIYILLF